MSVLEEKRVCVENNFKKIGRRRDEERRDERVQKKKKKL